MEANFRIALVKSTIKSRNFSYNDFYRVCLPDMNSQVFPILPLSQSFFFPQSSVSQHNPTKETITSLARRLRAVEIHIFLNICFIRIISTLQFEYLSLTQLFDSVKSRTVLT